MSNDPHQDEHPVNSRGGWGPWANYVLEGMKGMRGNYDALEKRVRQLEVEHAVQRTRLGLYAAIAGVIVVAAIEAIKTFLKP